MASIEGETARSWPNHRAFAIETVGSFAENLPGFDKALVNHLPESHVRLPSWRFFSHIPQLLSFGAALKAVFGDAIRKAGGPSAFALTPRREEPRSPSKARVPTRSTPLLERMPRMRSISPTSGYRSQSMSLFRTKIEDPTRSSLSPMSRRHRSLQDTSSKSHQGYSP